MKKNNYGLIAGIGIGVVLAVGGISISQHINKNNDKRNVEIKENNQKENIAASAKSSTKTEKKANKNQNDEVILIAEKFMNDYIDVNVKNWLDVQPVTESFRKAYNERSRALELSEALLNEVIKMEALPKSDVDILNRHQGVEYDALLGSSSFDINPDYSKFKLKSWNEKTGIAVLRDEIAPDKATGGCDTKGCEPKPINIEVEVKLVKSNGKWLVDGAGAVNMK